MAKDAGALVQDYTTSNLMIENNDLKRRIFMLEQEKIELQHVVKNNGGGEQPMNG